MNGPLHSLRDPIRLAIAAVWLTFGVGFKILDLVPRHRAIVGRIVGFGAPALAGFSHPLTILVGLAEAGLAAWVLSGIRPRACAAVQTIAILTMNALELTFARDLLLAPWPMVAANALLLAAAWYVALRPSPTAVRLS